MQDKSNLITGEGWQYWEDDGAWLKFNQRPDGETLGRLRAVATWWKPEQAWRAHLDNADAMLAIARKAQTWERVGAHPDYDDMMDDDFMGW